MRLSRLFPYLLGWLAVSAAAAPDVDPTALLAAQRAAKLSSEARGIETVTLTAGPAEIRLERGSLFAVVTADGTPTSEFVFRGDGRLRVAPESPLEQAQLELFTEATTLDETFTEAVLVMADPTQLATLTAAPASAAEASEAAAARATHEKWVGSRERALLGVPGALWRLGLGEKPFRTYFAGAFTTGNHGRVLYLVDPESDEQVTLGRFAPLDLDRKEERKLRRRLHREQRRGRLVGLELEDLGPWDTWISAPLATPGRAAFEPRHYDLTADVALDGTVKGRAEIEITAITGGVRTLALRLHPQAKITSVRDAAGAPLAHAVEEGSMIAQLPTAPAAGETTTVAIEFTGPFLERLNSARMGGDIWYLPDTTSWYPHTGTVDRATYEARITTARGVVVAPGAEAGSKPGKEGRFLIGRPCFGFTFEVGTFKTFTDTAGEIPITLHLDGTWRDLEFDGEEMVQATREALEYLQEVFGPLPFDRVTAVTAPRGYSQAFPGHLVLSDLQMSPYFGGGDWRTVIAHELAHQWWGHKVGFTSYRDQWLSEALASYASVLYAREKLDRQYVEGQFGPNDGWQGNLTSLTRQGMPVESVGPIVLGGRLDSSLADGYVPIVYQKGALIIDMMHNLLGPNVFQPALRKLLTGEQGGDMTTEEFLAGLEHHTGGDLDDLANRFIFDVGLPEIYYSYDFESSPDGKWAVVGTARQEAPYHYRYRLVQGASGVPDVVRTTVRRTLASKRADLAVPVEIGVFKTDLEDPSRGMSRAEKKAWEERVQREGNTVLRGRTLLEGLNAKFRFDTPYEPRILWFDRHDEIYCMFYDERRFPKRTALYRGIDHAAADRFAEAEAAFRSVVTAPLTTDPESERSSSWREDLIRMELDQLDRSAHQRLVRLLLDTDRVGEAAAALELAKGGDRNRMPLWQKHEERTLEARLALRQGKPERTVALLSEGIGRLEVESREGQALLAVAAWATGKPEIAADARKAAERAGIDLSLLDQPRP
jgi:Peptidase family M1 domain